LLNLLLEFNELEATLKIEVPELTSDVRLVYSLTVMAALIFGSFKRPLWPYTYMFNKKNKTKVNFNLISKFSKKTDLTKPIIKF
jgi:hypothetical protein